MLPNSRQRAEAEQVIQYLLGLYLFSRVLYFHSFEAPSPCPCKCHVRCRQMFPVEPVFAPVMLLFGPPSFKYLHPKVLCLASVWSALQWWGSNTKFGFDSNPESVINWGYSYLSLWLMHLTRTILLRRLLASEQQRGRAAPQTRLWFLRCLLKQSLLLSALNFPIIIERRSEFSTLLVDLPGSIAVQLASKPRSQTQKGQADFFSPRSIISGLIFSLAPPCYPPTEANNSVFFSSKVPLNQYVHIF